MVKNAACQIRKLNFEIMQLRMLVAWLKENFEIICKFYVVKITGYLHKPS